VSTPKTVAVTITVDKHTHAGKPIAKGETLTVDETTARWLIDNKIGTAAGTDAKKGAQ